MHYCCSPIAPSPSTTLTFLSDFPSHQFQQILLPLHAHANYCNVATFGVRNTVFAQTSMESYDFILFGVTPKRLYKGPPLPVH